jgi:hypothetical protein
MAIQYARHATAIESHPYSWTTLASILVRKMEGTHSLRDTIFPEAIALLHDVFRFEESRNWRPTPHPYATLLHAVTAYLDIGGKLSHAHRSLISERLEKCEIYFSRDAALQGAIASLAKRIQLT